MKRRALCVLSCVLSFVFLVSFTCSAVSSSPGEGYIYDSDGDFWYIPKSDTSDEAPTTKQFSKKSALFGASTFALTSTGINFPGFDINKLDVASFPDYVQNILSSPTSFAFLIVYSSTFYLYVADGCFPAVASTSGNLFIVNASLTNPSQAGYFTSEGFNPSTYSCYVGHYKWSADDTLYNEFYGSDTWQAADSKQVNRPNDGQYYFTYQIPKSLSTKTNDFYCFGSVVFRSLSVTSISYPLASGGNFQVAPGNWSSVCSRYNTWIASGSNNVSKFVLTDGGTFPTVQSQQAEVQRGILGAIRSIPDNIRGFFTSLGDRISSFFDNLFDKIRGLFIPADGYFETYSNDLKSFFESRFGFLFELPEAVVTIFQQLVSFVPAESGYSIHFPEVKTPHINSDSGGLIWTTIIAEQDFTFDFLNDAPFSTLYSGYRAFVWLAYCVMLINLAKSKADKVLGG